MQYRIGIRYATQQQHVIARVTNQQNMVYTLTLFFGLLALLYKKDQTLFKKN